MDISSQVKERILIVDDTPANIDVLGAMLSQAYDISVAVNGPTALEIAQSDSPPDLVLLDIMMPEMDGYEVARRLKADPVTRGIPIIFVTAKVDKEDEAFGFEIGAVDYLHKPVSSQVTLARIKSQLELKRLRDRISGELEKSRISASENRIYFRELFRSSPQGIVLLDGEGRILQVNQSFCLLLGYDTETDVMDQGIFHLIPGSDFDMAELIQKTWTGDTITSEALCLHREGYQIPVSLLAYPVSVQGETRGIFVFVENISHKKLFEERLKHQAFHDALTGIPNRQLFKQRLEYAIASVKQDQGEFAVLLIDLDRFKSINDTLGHHAGDELLKVVTQAIQGCLRSQDTLARLGGDEFAILLPGIWSRQTICKVATRIRDAVESPLHIQNQMVHISASIGIVLDTRNYNDANMLLRDADLAMYDAKDGGRAQFKFFTPESRESLMASVTLETELRKAINHDQLTLHYQPIVQLKDGLVSGFEALIRWDHPSRGLIFPDQFIPVAEGSGLMVPMGKWILETACRRLAMWQPQTNIGMNINISIKQFQEKCFVDDLGEIVSRCGISPCGVKLEFTESLLMAHTDFAVKQLEKLKDQGFTLSIDDFGTGYSSLSYLQQFPVDQIKIDRSFVQSMGVREESVEIVKSIISLAKGLGLSTVAEGVETKEQLEILRELSCDSAQGYFFAKPMPPLNAFTYLNHNLAL
ncbi:MAG: EAL domain-containing protein [Desulfobacterales bacterium]|nr:EAL domain-containing protein [Desulfobacterales bacterium]